MIKKAYNIKGFDCANCATKVEEYLNKREEISYARLDFAGDKLYINFKSNELSIEKIKEIISEVEDDPIEIYPLSINKKTTTKIVTKDIVYLLIRILVSISLLVAGKFIFPGHEFSLTNMLINLLSMVIISYDIFWKSIKKVIKLQNPFDEYFLIVIASTGAFILACLNTNDYLDGILVVVLFQIGQVIESIATNRSKSAIVSAIDMRAELANLIENGQIKVVNPRELKVDDRIIVKVGEIIPVDGVILSGEGNIDTSSLTGEFIPVHAKEGEDVFSGTILKSGSLTIKVKKEFSQSTVSKILELVTSSGERKSKADKFITKFAKIYTPVVMLISALFILFGGLISGNWSNFIFRGLEFLVVACPCAIVISVPLAYFSAIGLASKNGIVIKGTNYLDEFVRLGKLFTDKTGTLTRGTFTIQKVVTSEISEEKLLDYLYAAECLSSHPIGKAICHGQDIKQYALAQTNYTEISGLGVKTTYNGRNIIAGSTKLLDENNISYIKNQDNGTLVYVAVDGKYVGYVKLSDTEKEDAQPMVDLLHKEGVEIILLTGDKKDNAKQVCESLGIDRWHAELLPDQKEKIIEQEMENYKKSVAYIGDGVNDAPSIVRSDIGIAMGGIGSDIAVENADVIIMNDDPAKVYDAIKIGKIARKTSIFNIAFALAIKIGVMIICALLDVPMFVAVLADTGLTVLLVINSLLILTRNVKRKKVGACKI